MSATNDYFGLKDKRVLITGASRGLGQVCAEAFADVGAAVLLTARSGDRLETIQAALPNPDNHKVVTGDMRLQADVEKVADAAMEFGDIDVVLHCMGGGLGMREPLLDWDEFDALFRTNLQAAAELNRHLIPGMSERQTGNIIHVGSVASTDAVGSVGYNSIKAAVAAYTRSLGRHLADTGIIVTAILPGGFWAPDNAMERLQQRAPDALQKIIEERLPQKRLADPGELVALLFFLASRQATFMTGCSVPIDGGEGLTYVT